MAVYVKSVPMTISGGGGYSFTLEQLQDRINTCNTELIEMLTERRVLEEHGLLIEAEGDKKSFIKRAIDKLIEWFNLIKTKFTEGIKRIVAKLKGTKEDEKRPAEAAKAAEEAIDNMQDVAKADAEGKFDTDEPGDDEPKDEDSRKNTTPHMPSDVEGLKDHPRYSPKPKVDKGPKQPGRVSAGSRYKPSDRLTKAQKASYAKMANMFNTKSVKMIRNKASITVWDVDIEKLIKMIGNGEYQDKSKEEITKIIEDECMKRMLKNSYGDIIKSIDDIVFENYFRIDDMPLSDMKKKDISDLEGIATSGQDYAKCIENKTRTGIPEKIIEDTINNYIIRNRYGMARTFRGKLEDDGSDEITSKEINAFIMQNQMILSTIMTIRSNIFRRMAAVSYRSSHEALHCLETVADCGGMTQYRKAKLRVTGAQGPLPA